MANGQPSACGPQSGRPLSDVADINNDGHADLIAGFSSGPTVLLGHGDGTFSVVAGSPFPPTGFHEMRDGTLADVNGDGNLDLVSSLMIVDNDIGEYVPGAFGVFFGDGTGKLSFNLNTVVDTNAFAPSALAAANVADYDGDGKLDLLISSASALTVYHGNGNGTFSPGTVSTKTIANHDDKFTVADVNGDGHPDLIAYDPQASDDGGPQGFDVYPGDGSGGFQLSNQSPITTNGYVRSFAVGDFNNDGHADVAVTTVIISGLDETDGSSVEVFSGDGLGGFSSGQEVVVGNGTDQVTEYRSNGTVSAGTFVVPNFLTGVNNAAATGGVESVVAATLSGATFADGNTSATASEYMVSAVDWGDGSANAAGLSISGSGGAYTIGGSHLYAEDGVYNFTITVKDSGGSTATISGSASVADAPLIGITTAAADGGVESVTPATLSGATFTDANLGAPRTDFSIRAVDWGDGGANTADLSISGSGGTYTIDGSHLYAEDGVYNFTITVKDSGGSTATITGSANVADAPVDATGGSVHATESATLSGTLATFIDANPSAPQSDFSASIDWGDHSPLTNVSSSQIFQAGGRFSVPASHVYAEEGTYSVTVTVNDAGGAAAIATLVATVDDAPLSATAVSITEGGFFNGTVATFTDANAAGAAGDYTAEIDWGDGMLSSAQITESDGMFNASSGHVYAPGIYTMTVFVRDLGGATATVHPVATVEGAPLTALVEDTYVIGSGTVSVSAANGVLANDTGPGQLTAVTGTVAGNEGGTFLFSADGSFTYTPPGNFSGFDSAQYTAKDAAGEQGTATVNVLSQAGGVIWKFYEQLLHRDPDESGLQGWIEDFSKGGTPGDIAAGFFESTELLNQVVTGYYQQYLGRAPQGNDLDYWGRAWRENGGPELIKAQFASSQEFNTLADKQYGAYPDGWLTALYERVLNRTPQGNDLPFWEQQLAGGLTEGQVALDFFASPEGFGNDVAGWFNEYLGRAPTSAERAKYVNRMVGGASDRDIEQAITNLPEYAANPPASPAGSGVRLPDYLPQAGSTKKEAAVDAFFAAL